MRRCRVENEKVDSVGKSRPIDVDWGAVALGGWTLVDFGSRVGSKVGVKVGDAHVVKQWEKWGVVPETLRRQH